MVVETKRVKVNFVKMPHYVETPANLTYSTPDAVCFDICAAIDEPIVLKCGEHYPVPTAVKFYAPAPIWYRINSRSGLAAKFGIITAGGIIDPDYRGELKVIMVNTNAESSGKDYVVHPGDKIAQVELPFPYKADFEEVSEEEYARFEAVRGDNGFGSSGR